jgi:hypothetical protein
MAFAGNIICYLGAKPVFYKATPILPAEMFKERFPLNLRSAANNIDTFIRVRICPVEDCYDVKLNPFIQIEHPQQSIPLSGRVIRILEHDLSIGEFYSKVEAGLLIKLAYSGGISLTTDFH